MRRLLSELQPRKLLRRKKLPPRMPPEPKLLQSLLPTVLLSHWSVSVVCRRRLCTPQLMPLLWRLGSLFWRLLRIIATAAGWLSAMFALDATCLLARACVNCAFKVNALFLVFITNNNTNNNNKHKMLWIEHFPCIQKICVPDVWTQR